MSCCVPYCESSIYNKGDKTKHSYHQFPIDFDLKKKWIVAIGRKDSETGKYWIPNKNSVVCDLHFSPRQLQPKKGALIKGSIPYIFPDYSLPEYGTLIDEKELALVDLSEEKHALMVQEKRYKARIKKSKNKSAISNAFSITNSTDSTQNTKKRSFLEINSDKNEPFEKSTNISKKLNKTNVAIDESNEGNDLNCALLDSDDFPIFEDDSFEANKNTPPKDDNTKQTFCTVNSSQLLQQDNDQILVYKETDFNTSKTNSAIKVVELSLSLPKTDHTYDKAIHPLHTIDVRNVSKDNVKIANKATSSNQSKTDPVIKIKKIPFYLPGNSKSLKIQIPSDICLNGSSSSSPNTSTNANFDLLPMQGNNNSIVSTQQENRVLLGHIVNKNVIIPSSQTTIEPTMEISENVNLPAVQGTKSTTVIKEQSKHQELFKHINEINVTKPVKETIIHPSLENMSEHDKQLLNRLKEETVENNKLTMQLFQLQEEYENVSYSDESMEEKISLYNIEALKTGIANADRKALFLSDQLSTLTEEKTTWSECTMEFADKLEEKLPACYDFLRKTNVISLPPPKKQRENSGSQTNKTNIC